MRTLRFLWLSLAATLAFAGLVYVVVDGLEPSCGPRRPTGCGLSEPVEELFEEP